MAEQISNLKINMWYLWKKFLSAKSSNNILWDLEEQVVIGIKKEGDEGEKGEQRWPTQGKQEQGTEKTGTKNGFAEMSGRCHHPFICLHRA